MSPEALSELISSIAHNLVAAGQAGGAKTLEEAGRSGGTDSVINGMED